MPGGIDLIILLHILPAITFSQMLILFLVIFIPSIHFNPSLYQRPFTIYQ